MQGFKLTFFTQQDRSVHGQSLALWLLEQAKEIGIRGATLTAFTHPNHIAYLCSWGFAHLSPCCNANYFGYKHSSIVNI